MTVVWLRERDGTLLAEVEDWSVTENPSVRRRLEPGQCSLSIPMSDPSVDVLWWDDAPDPAMPWHTWWDMDLEVALWPEGTVGVEPDGDPWWAGPVVSVAAVTGRCEVTAWTQEAYLQRSPVGGQVANWYADADPDVDTDLDEWTINSGTPETVTGPPRYLGSSRSIISYFEDSLYTQARLPLSETGNYAIVTVPVFIPVGHSLASTWVAAVELHTADPEEPGEGVAWATDPDYVWILEVPADWEDGRWYLPYVMVPQPADREVRYRTTYIGVGNPWLRFGRPFLERPENVSAVADTDIGTFPAAVYDQQIDLLPGPWVRDNDEVGIDLAEPMRSFTRDHEPSTDLVNDLAGFGEGWVHELTMHWAEARGIYQGAVSFDVTTLSGWRYEVDASAASTALVGQYRFPEGGRDELWVGDDSVQRLVGVEQVPEGLSASDAHEWLLAALARSGPVGRLTGPPAPATPPGPGTVADWGVGDWMDVTLDLGGGRTIEVQPVVDGVEWDPVTHRVTPSQWVLGGDAKQDPLEMLSARLRADERATRTRLREGPSAGSRTAQQWTVPSADVADTVSHSFNLPPGLKTVRAQHVRNAVSPPEDAGLIGVTIVEDGYNQASQESRLESVDATLTTRARRVTVFASLTDFDTAPTQRFVLLTATHHGGT